MKGWLLPRLIDHRRGTAFAVGPDGRVAFALVELGDILLSVRTIDGPGLPLRRLPATINTPGREEMLRIAFDPDGTIWLVYVSVEPRHYRIMLTSSRDGRRWQPPRKISVMLRRPERLDVAAIGRGKVIVFSRSFRPDVVLATTITGQAKPKTVTVSSKRKLNINADLNFLVASSGEWHLLVGRQVFSCADGEKWQAKGKLVTGNENYENVRGFLELRPGTFWIVSTSTPGATAIYETQDLLRTKKVCDLPKSLAGLELQRDRKGFYWLKWRQWFMRTAEPRLPMFVPDKKKAK